MEQNNNTFGEPLYITIAGSLRRKIMGGEFNPGNLLPSENVLSTQYHTSRETVWKSLNILEKEGFIYSRAGKGSYISSPQHNVFSMSFSEDDSGNQTKYRNITVIEPSEEIRNALELNSSDKVIEISRVISRNGIRRWENSTYTAVWTIRSTACNIQVFHRPGWTLYWIRQKIYAAELRQAKSQFRLFWTLLNLLKRQQIFPAKSAAVSLYPCTQELYSLIFFNISSPCSPLAGVGW